MVHPLSHVVLIVVYSIKVQGHELALLVFDRAVGEGLPSEKNILSLIKVRTRHSRLC